MLAGYSNFKSYILLQHVIAACLIDSTPVSLAVVISRTFLSVSWVSRFAGRYFIRRVSCSHVCSSGGSQRRPCGRVQHGKHSRHHALQARVIYFCTMTHSLISLHSVDNSFFSHQVPLPRPLWDHLTPRTGAPWDWTRMKKKTRLLECWLYRDRVVLNQKRLLVVPRKLVSVWRATGVKDVKTRPTNYLSHR